MFYKINSRFKIKNEIEIERHLKILTIFFMDFLFLIKKLKKLPRKVTIMNSKVIYKNIR